MGVTIRAAELADWQEIWPIWQAIVARGDTYEWDPGTPEDVARRVWMLGPPAKVFVAVADDGRVVGTSKIAPNRGGLGDHVANASYMVDPARGGEGIGRRLCEHSLQQAKADGFHAMQFNAVVETNVHAVRLYEKLGFSVVGTVPEAFRHAEKGLIGLHVMWRRL
jgi:L-amino acid N-acyltransferase YncA